MKPLDAPPPFIVGIGASAGGLAAFKTFLDNTPKDTGMAFILVQHLDPAHSSMLVELLSEHSSMPVLLAEDGVPIQADHVYVIPPDATLTVSHGKLKVSKPAPAREHRRPIDTFFLSLAEDQGANAAAIILSGVGNDGAGGARAVSANGGLVLAQAGPDGAALSGMPQSAVSTGDIDDVVPVESMTSILVEHVLGPSGRGNWGQTQDDPEAWAATLLEIAKIVQSRTGHDFSNYKKNTQVRRITRRMQHLGIREVAGYLDRLRDDPTEAQLLFGEMLIGVTQFFRDPPAYAALSETVIPKLLENRSPKDAIRVWIAGCSTGEEVYSIAILLAEAIEAAQIPIEMTIFGTDVNPGAIVAARSGKYHKPLPGLSEQRLARWFINDHGVYTPIKAIRDKCIFSAHSLIKDPPFSKLDLISCRNVLIYLNGNLQDRVFQIFRYALKPGGFLLLGPSERIGPNAESFSIIDRSQRILQRKSSIAETQTRYSGPFPAATPPAKSAPENFMLRNVRKSLSSNRSTPLDWLRTKLSQSRRQVEIDALIEEHKSATEELQSINEELQSSNEELETAKEEMQAANEELQAVNSELNGKNDALERLNNDMRNLLDSTQIATLFLSKSSIIRAFTPAMREIFHLRDGDCGRPIREIVGLLDYDSIEADADSVLRTLVVVERELRLRSDPSTVYSLRVRPYRTSNDQIDGVVLTFFDISPIKRALADKITAEENFLLAKDAIGICAWVLDRETGVVSGSDKMMQLVGYMPADGILDLNWFRQRMDAEEVAKLEAAFRKQPKQIKDYQFEFRLKRNEDAIWLLARGRNVLNPKTNSYEIRGILLDISEQVNLKHALEQRQRLEALGRLTGGVAHDFNNMLTIILGNLNLVASEPMSTRAKTFIDEAVHAAQMSALFNQKLLSFGRSQKLNAVATDLHEEIKTCLPLLQRTVGPSITLRADLKATELHVKIDVAELQAALINLIGNARDAMPSGGQIVVETADVHVDEASAPRAAAAPGNYCQVTVRDAGLGMAPDILAKAVEPFFTTKGEQGGTGLGLASVQGFVEQSLGYVTIQSEVGLGTSVSLHFPVVPPAIVQADPPVRENMTSDSKPLLVMVVEDNEALLKVAVAFLQKLGHQCLTATNAKEALSYLESTPNIDVLFSDVILPAGQSGFDLARIVRSRWPNIRILMTSGFSGQVPLADPLDASVPFLKKPYSTEQLAAAIAASQTS